MPLSPKLQSIALTNAERIKLAKKGAMKTNPDKLKKQHNRQHRIAADLRYWPGLR